MKLTKATVEVANLPENGQRFLWDDELKGFGVRLTPTAKTYVVQARVAGITRRITLGKHGVLTAQEARKRALKELAGMSQGTDPAKEKRATKARVVTLEQVVTAYLKDRRGLKASTRAEIEKHLKVSFGEWAGLPIVDITRDMALARFRKLSDRSQAQANQAFRCLRAWINYATGAYQVSGKPLITDNPVKAISDSKMWHHIKPRTGKIPLDKIGMAWAEIQRQRTAPEQNAIGRTIADVVLFLMVTGARFGEAAELTWDRVDLDGATWHLPDPKNRTPITRPLPKVAADMLRDRPHDGDFVFPGRSGGHVRELRGLLVKISGLIGADVRAHDLRRTFRAIATECRVEYWKIKLLMGHRIGQDVTISHYTETSDLRYLQEDIERIGNWITSQAAPGEAVNNVLPFRARRA